MRTVWRAAGAVGLILAGGLLAEGFTANAVVTDVPYARVWEAALRAVAGYPLERAADGVIVTGRVERLPRGDEEGLERIAERITLRVERFGEGVTRVTVDVEAEGWRAGAWVRWPATEATARAVLARLRAAT